MHEIKEDLLWTGNAGDVREPRVLFESGIGAVIDLAIEELPAQLPRQLALAAYLGHSPEDLLSKINETRSIELHGALWNDVSGIFADVRGRV